MKQGMDGTPSLDDLRDLLEVLSRHGVLEFEGHGVKVTMVARAPTLPVASTEELAEEREMRDALREVRKKRGLSPDEDPLLDG